MYYLVVKIKEYIKQNEEKRSEIRMAKYLGIEASDKQPYIFVSYNSEDEQRVGKIVGELCHYNINIWYDYGLTVGEKWEKEIADHIPLPHEVCTMTDCVAPV